MDIHDSSDNGGYSMIDMGCGDGRWLLRAAQIYPSLRFGVGVEMDQDRLRIANELKASLLCRQGARVDFLCSNFASINLTFFDVIIFYLSRVGNEMIKEKILLECCEKKKYVIIAVGFQVVGWRVVKLYNCSSDGVAGGLPAFKYILNNE